MTEPDPPVPSGWAPAHPGPPSGWRPMSGLALASFVLSVLYLFVAMMMGLWILGLVPLALAGFALARVPWSRWRGRMLAIWALVLTLAGGSCSMFLHGLARQALEEVPVSLLTALASKADAEDRAQALRRWAWPKALEEDEQLVATWQTRFERVVHAYGRWTGDIEGGSLWKGVHTLFQPPGEAIAEVGTSAPPPEWDPLAVIWTRAAFERGNVHVAVLLGGGAQEAMKTVQEKTGGRGGPAPIVGDLRFFVPGEPSPGEPAAEPAGEGAGEGSAPPGDAPGDDGAGDR